MQFLPVLLKRFLFFPFLWSHLQHMEVPGQGSNRSYSCQPTPQPQQCRNQAASVTYTAACGNAGSLTYWARPGIEGPHPYQHCIGFLTCWDTTGTLQCLLLEPSCDAMGCLGHTKRLLQGSTWQLHLGSQPTDTGGEITTGSSDCNHVGELRWELLSKNCPAEPQSTSREVTIKKY